MYKEIFDVVYDRGIFLQLTCWHSCHRACILTVCTYHPHIKHSTSKPAQINNYFNFHGHNGDQRNFAKQVHQAEMKERRA